MRVFLFIFILIFALGGAAFSQAPAIFNDATDLAKEGRYLEALEKYRGLTLAKENSEFAAKIHFNTGVCFYHLGQFENAVAQYQAAIEINGRYQKAFYALGMAQIARGKTGDAKRAFSAAVNLNKKDGEAWFDLGLVLLAESDEKYYDAAGAAFENAAKNNSINSADALNNLGVIAALKGDFTAAEKRFKEALKKGASLEAANNLQICARYRQNAGGDLIASLTFSSRNFVRLV